MLELGVVVFNFDMWGFWIGIALWAFMYWAMPKRATIGIVVSAVVISLFVLFAPPVEGGLEGEFIYVGVVFWVGTMFTCMMSPVAIIGFIIGYKATR